MKRLLTLCILFAMFHVEASDVIIGTITSTGSSVTNATTTTPFTWSNPCYLSIQCDAKAYIVIGTSSAVASTSSTGVTLAADALYDIKTQQNQSWIAVISSSGTSNCKVFKVIPQP